MTFTITAYEHTVIRARDRARAISFYRSLGWREIPEGSHPESRLLTNEAGVRIKLCFDDGMREGAAWRGAALRPVGLAHVTFAVDDLVMLLVTLARRGIRVLTGPHMIEPSRCAVFVRDPDGNLLEFTQHVAAAHARPQDGQVSPGDAPLAERAPGAALEGPGPMLSAAWRPRR